MASAYGQEQDQAAVTVPLHTQSIDEVLQSVSVNNPELQSLVKDTEAAQLQLKTENMLEDPTVEYSSFYSRNVTGQSGSELVVSPGVRLPYSICHKAQAEQTCKRIP